MVAEGPLDDLRGSIGTRFTVQFAQALDPDELARLRTSAGVQRVHREGGLVVIDHTGSPDELLKTLAEHTVSHLRAEPPDLEESVLQLYRGGQDEERAS